MPAFSSLGPDNKRKAVLVAILILIGGVLFWLSDWGTCCANDAEIPRMGDMPMMKDAMYSRAKEITAPAGYVNTDGKPITISEFIGKDIVMVDFLTYSCINCVRAQPYLNAWHEKYKDAGLVIIGIHTPEFEFEKDVNNVTRAMRDMEVKYPIVLDNDYGTWRAYQNSYWPRKYLIDIDGYIVYDHIGEGGYEETERVIQKLLAERAQKLGLSAGETAGFVNPNATAAPSQDGMRRTPEIYFGASRNRRYLGNGDASTVGTQTLEIPSSLQPDTLYLGGTWQITPESAISQGEGARIKLQYRAKDIYMVARADTAVKVKVLVDGKALTKGNALAGSDIGADGFLTVKEERLYKVIEGEYGARSFELEITNGSLDVFTFTFG